MLYTSIIPNSWVTKILSRSVIQGGYVSEVGVVANTYDLNDATYIEDYIAHGGDGTVEGSMQIEYTWAKPLTIATIRAKAKIDNNAGNYTNANSSISQWLRINGTWTKIDEALSTSSWSNSRGTALSYDITVSTGWALVTGYRIYIYGRQYSYEGDRNQRIWPMIYEVAVNREKLVEIVRIKKPSGIISIGSNALTSAHKLRINKNGTIYGIPLLDTDDPMASPIRIYSGSAVKALALAD